MIVKLRLALPVACQNPGNLVASRAVGIDQRCSVAGMRGDTVQRLLVEMTEGTGGSAGGVAMDAKLRQSIFGKFQGRAENLAVDVLDAGVDQVIGVAAIPGAGK